MSTRSTIVSWVTSTDHKVIGYMYLVSSVAWFLIGGVLALIIRAQLFAPGLEVVATKEQYNQLFTMHGTIMLLMFATPLFTGFANVMMPLQIGAPDVAFPRLNAFSFWLYTFGSLIAVGGFLTRRAPRRLVGSRTLRSRQKPSRRASAATCGCSGSASRASARFSAR